MPSEPETSKVPIAPMGIPADLPNRLSSFNSDRYLVLSGICTCQPRLQTSHRPDGKMADVVASTLACTTAADAPVNYRGYMQQRPKTSHRPHGRLKFCSFFAGRWCRGFGWHGELLILHHHWQHSLLCACSCSKLPIAPMGKLLTRLPRLTLAQLRTLLSTTVGTCHRDLENFPSPRWEKC